MHIIIIPLILTYPHFLVVMYRQRYGNELRQTSELPDFCGGAERPSASRSGEVELVGDVDALRYVDLEAYGLGQYRRYVQ